MTPTDGNGLSVLLLRPSAWQVLIDAAASDAGRVSNSLEPRLAASIIESLHALHIGIPPHAAWGLAAVLLRPGLRPENYAAPWHDVARALATARDELYAGRQARAQETTLPMRLNASIPYTVFQIAAPVMEQACRRLGRVVLFSQDAEAAAMPLADYTAFANALMETINELATYDPQGPLALFWQERAMAIVDMTIARPSRMLAKESLPHADPQELGLFQRLRPDLDRDQRKAPDFLLARRPRAWEDRRRRDAGVEGVTITRRPEDIQRRLFSELIYTDIIQLDRLLNSGYWVLNRPPKPMEMRDLLVVAIHPGSASGIISPTQDSFVKATWFEFASYIAGILQAEGMVQTELRWIDGDACRRWRSLSLRLSDLPDLPATSRTSSAFRNTFRLRSGWLPHLFDRRARYQTLPLRDPNRVNETLPNTVGWASGVWLEQRESAAWLSHQSSFRLEESHHVPVATAFIDKPIETQRFFLIHLMLLLPEQLRPNDGEGAKSNVYSQRNKLLQLFQLDSPGHSISITWIPQDLANGEWCIDAHTHLDPQMASTSSDERGQHVATQLIRKWTENLALEMANG